MADIVIDGVTYTTDALCVYRRDDNSGDWQASLHGCYHAVAHTPRMAVLRLAAYLGREHGEIFAGHRHHFDAYLDQFCIADEEAE